MNTAVRVASIFFIGLCCSSFAADARDYDRSVGSGIQVVAGTYGGNCRQPRGNKTAHLARACNGRGACRYTVDYRVIGDPARGCAKNCVAEWRCGGGSRVYRAKVAPEAGYKKTVELRCSR